jgi:Ecdysteroid kinase-like family
VTATKVPTSIGDIDGHWLAEVFDSPVQVVGAPERMSSFACEVFRLRLAGTSGEVPPSVIVKLPVLGPIRPLVDGLGLYRKEVQFYQYIAPNCPLKTPESYVALLAEGSTDFVLVLQDLAPLHTGDQLTGLSISEAQLIIDELAKFHAWSWESPILAEHADTFRAIDSPAGRAMGEQWGEFFAVGWQVAATLAGDALSAPLRAFADRFADYIPFFLDELASPRVLSHGELRADNVILDGENRPYFIDFQNTQQECGPRELAYFVSMSLDPEVRRGKDEALVRRYWEGLQSWGVRSYSFQDAWRQYRLGLANQFMMVVVACMRYEAADDRGKSVLASLIRRGLIAIQDNDSLALLPP